MPKYRSSGFILSEAPVSSREDSGLRKSLTGFTIIELLIATTIFSVILLLCATALLQIGRLYYKGITTSKTQEAARTVMDEISRTIQFGGGTTSFQVVGANNSFCVGSKRYTYLLGVQQNDNPTGNQKRNVLVTDTSPTCAPQDLVLTGASAASRELIASRMRLSNLQITEDLPANPGLFKVKLRVVYGDDDLLCSPALNNCNNTSVLTTAEFAAATDLSCKGFQSGSQFCAVSELSTVVKKRVR